MSRLPRLVIPGIPYHVTQRGNRRAQTFFEAADYALYRDLLAQSAHKAGAQVWCYCLMPNHVHIIVVPSDADGLRRTFADTHRRYTGYINARNRWTGHLWQGRFGAVAMDEAHLAAAVRYVSLNPVRARLVARPQDWRWSSVAAHLAQQDDPLVVVAPVIERYWRLCRISGRSGCARCGWARCGLAGLANVGNVRQTAGQRRMAGSDGGQNRQNPATPKTRPKTKDPDNFVNLVNWHRNYRNCTVIATHPVEFDARRCAKTTHAIRGELPAFYSVLCTQPESCRPIATRAYNLAPRNRKALPITDTELRLIAAAAIIGLRSRPKAG